MQRIASEYFDFTTFHAKKKWRKKKEAEISLLSASFLAKPQMSSCCMWFSTQLHGNCITAKMKQYNFKGSPEQRNIMGPLDRLGVENTLTWVFQSVFQCIHTVLSRLSQGTAHHLKAVPDPVFILFSNDFAWPTGQGQAEHCKDFYYLEYCSVYNPDGDLRSGLFKTWCLKVTKTQPWALPFCGWQSVTSLTRSACWH